MRAVLLFLVAALLVPLPVRADQPCDFIPMPCTFEAPAFTFIVVDAETRRGLVDVHALAEWEQIGQCGRGSGPLMALDAVSGPDGQLSFPGWGPIQGPISGLEIGRDPVITLFKAGYKALVINNGGANETERVRKFRHS